MSTIFCICLLFSATAFVFGRLLLNTELKIFDFENRQWMGFLQISLCIIFITIYYSILSLKQIIELKQQYKNIRIIHHLGKSESQIKALMKTQILMNLLVPTLICFVILCICMPFINYKMNVILPVIACNSLVMAFVEFLGCFAILCVCYFLTVHIISKRYIKNVIKQF